MTPPDFNTESQNQVYRNNYGNSFANGLYKFI